MKSLKSCLLASTLLALSAVGGAAHAADAAAPAAAAGDGATLEPVIVTARRVEENQQRVPTTVTAVTGEQMRTQNIVSVADLQTVAPSLTVASYFNGLNDRFAVRGLSAGVTTYFADAPCCGGIASAPLMDIASTQVLNGPQGTLFGRSSAAGAVLIYPVRPDLNDYSGLIDGTVGSYNRTQITGVVNIPIIKDTLAIRLAVNSNHVDGYTKLIGQSDKLDGVDNQQYRLGVEFRAGAFENYLVGSYLNVDQSATSLVLAAYNPNFALYKTTAATGPATFGAVCGQAVSLGLASDANSCISQRVGILQNIAQRLVDETARLSAGHSAARSTLPSYDGQTLNAQERHGSVVDIAQYDFGQVGPVELSVKNIFSFDSFTSNSATTNDGIGGIGEEGAFANAFYSTFGSNNEVGARLTPKLGPAQKTYTEEFQLHGKLNDGLVVGTLGYFYQYQRAPRNAEGGTNFYKLFGGVLNPNLGYNSATGFIAKSWNEESAWYTQATLDLSKVGVHGLSLTAGYRKSWDETYLATNPATITYPSGVYVPGATTSITDTKSNGYNYTFSVAEQFTDKLMAYATVSRAYVPGGVNALGQNATSLPGFTPTYGPETVLETELGIKSEFNVGGVIGRINADVYNNDFSNIVETLTGLVGNTSIRYNENIAGARLRGFEIAGTLIPNRAWEVNFGYSYNDAKYTRWTGSDPFNVAKPGDPRCVAASPAGQCYLDLSNNPFPYMPEQQGHVTVTYTLPVPDSLGVMKASAIGYAQSRVYFEPTAFRDLQLLPGGLDGVSQSGYATLNLRLDWKDVKLSGWNAALFVNNVTDELYATGKIAQLQTLGFAAANYAPPREFGIQVWKTFGP